ncbi:MAG: Serine/threonine protein kinase PrkC, regulator of stationary phase [Myxococcaceae bacterium]|nr:Serine/threonine protein kinase PrkC, regulator of stationary phase [Myxococcaceae bacterium]
MRMAVMLTAASRRLGRYELLSYLGSGGMSDVYVALHTGLRKRVALKLLRPALRCDDYAVQRFLREGECAARVRHPNVVDVSDVGMENGVPYLVMELLEGESLAQTLTRGGALDLESAIDLLLPIFDAVSAVHAVGVLHRDVKPANILLARAADGSVLPKLVDFGIALLPEHTDDADRALGPLGTPHYMSPEQARGEHTDERSDQYALASVLFEMLTGREPYEGKTVDAVLHEVARGKFPRVRSLQPMLPLMFEEVLVRATSRNPGQRFASVSDFAYALVPFASARTRKLFVTREERAGVYSAQLLSGNYRTEPRQEAVSVAASFAPRSVSRQLGRSWLRMLGGAALLGIGLVAGFAVTHGVAEAEKAVPQQGALELALAPSAALAAPLQRTVRLVPPEAMASLDGAELGRGDFVLPELSDGVHELRISAPGHIARVVLFRDALEDSTIVLDPRRR